MSPFQYCALLGLVVLFFASSAIADLPSLMSDHPGAATPANSNSANQGEPLPGGINDLKSLQKLYFTAGPVAYRFSSNGLKTKFVYGATPVNALIGYRGKYRLEFNPSGTTKVRVGYDRAELNGSFRVEFAAAF